VKALLLSALVASALSFPGPARALPTQLVYDILSPDGPDLSNANELGLLFFDLDADLGKSCRYYMEWTDNLDREALSVDCYINEAKTHGATSCVANSGALVPTVLINDRSLPCTGFNTNGVISSVFLLIAGESYTTGKLDGIIQFTAANTVLYALDAAPYP
jgi:hypothetical protein